MREEILRVEKLTTVNNQKSILRNFHLKLNKGESLGLFMGKANEKDCLINALTGKSNIVECNLYFNDKLVHQNDYISFSSKKIAIIEKNGNLLDDFSIGDNIFVFKKNFKKHVIPKKVLVKQTQRLLDEFDFDYDPNMEVKGLELWQKYLIEILKSYAYGKKIIVIKDMSSFLSTKDIKSLGLTLSKFKEKGLSFIIIDEYIRILSDISDKLSVVKGGTNLWDFNEGNFQKKAIDLIYQSNIQNLIEENTVLSSEEVLSFTNVEGKNFEDLSFTIHKGEIVTLYNEDGKSVEDILDVLSGDYTPIKGKMTFNKKPFNIKDYSDGVKKGIAFINNGNIKSALFTDMTGINNLFFPLYKKIRMLNMRPAYKKNIYNTYKEYFPNDALNKYTSELNSSELHKLTYLKWHLYNPKVLVCVKPFSSGDLKLRDLTSFLINKLALKGISILIISANYSESYIMASRVIELKSK